MYRIAVALFIFSTLLGCSRALDTPLPKELEKMESIKPAMEKLKPEERELVASYVMRHTVGAKVGAMFGGKEGPGIPDGMTIGKAIDEQRSYLAEAKLEEAKQEALKAKLKAEREAALKAMREAVTVTLVSKRLAIERGYSGMVMDENIEVVFGYKNNTTKDVSGVKGRISVQDLFGDEISAFQVSNDATIKTGESNTWTGSRSVKFSVGHNDDRKLADLSDDKYKIVWVPQVIVFKDGSKMVAQE